MKRIVLMVMGLATATVFQPGCTTPQDTSLYRISVLLSAAPIASTAGPGLAPIDIEVNDQLIEGIGFDQEATLFFDYLTDGDALWVDFYLRRGTRLSIAGADYVTAAEDSLVKMEVDVEASPPVASIVLDEPLATAGVTVPRGLLTRYEYRQGWSSLGSLSPEEAAGEI